jgi:predicted ATPase
MLDIILFSPVTIFYGSNGSGKSSLLNVIAEKINLPHKTTGNSSLSFFNEFIEKCSFEMAVKNEKPLKIPPDSRFIRSEDIMEGIVHLRKETVKAENEIIRLHNIDGIGEKEMRYAISHYNEITEQFSNGETAMAFFENIFEPDTLYVLDEPENSLSPRLQLLLKELIEKYAFLLNCQFIIATHSPFLLSVESASIYNLDRCPSYVCDWYELENVRVYYDFLKKNNRLFEN